MQGVITTLLELAYLPPHTSLHAGKVKPTLVAGGRPAWSNTAPADSAAQRLFLVLPLHDMVRVQQHSIVPGTSEFRSTGASVGSVMLTWLMMYPLCCCCPAGDGLLQQ